jgi:hypothetical protein
MAQKVSGSDQLGRHAERSRSATTVGILFIVATVFFVVGQSIYSPILDASDYLDRAYSQQATVVGGMLIGLIAALAIPLIPAFMFPLFKSESESWALGYLAMRLIEAILLVAALVLSMAQLNFSEMYLAGEANAADLNSLNIALGAIGEWAFALSVGIVFPAGALILYGLLYRQQLVPSWISIWGFASALLLLVGSVALLLGLDTGTQPGLLEGLLAGPIAVNEMVLAAWLIVKGFNRQVV